MPEPVKNNINIPFLFFLSGVSGLIYETVWFRMLIRVFGTTLEATSTALAVFMGGLALGAWLIGRKADKIKNPLRCYAFIEIAVGLLAAAATILLINLPQLIAGLLPEGAGFAAGLGRGLLRIVVAGAILLPPTILMGATLPLLTGYLSKSLGEAGGKLSRLYALNTFGAVAGVLVSGFLLIGHLGETATVMAAAALNILIALRVFVCRPAEGDSLRPEMQPQSPPDARGVYRKLAFILGLSGFAALGLEVLWARMLILAIGNSVYAFAAMLGVYLTGIALGSRYAEHKLPALSAPFETLAKAQALTSALALAGFGVFWLIGRTTLDAKYLYSPLTQASDILMMFGWAALIILPVTFIMGFFFPVAVSAGVKLSGRIGGGVGTLYAANTLGAILGSLAAGFVLIPFLGTKYSFILIAILTALTGAILAGMGGAEAKRRYGAWMALPIMAAFAAFIVPDPVFSIIEGRIMHNQPGEIVFHAEEKAGAVTVCFADNGAVQYLCINGFVVSGNGPAGKLMSHFPLLFQENPKEMFIIGLGVGSALRSAVLHGVHVDVAELVASVAEAGPLFTPGWDELLKRNKFRVILNDGRNELLRTKKTYDAIVVDVTPPIYSSGAVNVYSRDFFKLARKKLSAGGVLSLWIPKPCFESDYFMILKSLKAVFSYVNVWSFPELPGFLALASNNELDMTPKTLEARIKRGRARLDLPPLSPEFISHYRIMTNDEVAAASAPYPAVTDDKPFTEFPLVRFLAFSPVWY
ncbi:MAG: fused MFS/spermidine synthase [Elusimicrobia bacterium]|nr:fused MFS/spermidine synthase [Elusimicrobiota bacterium]